MTPEEYDLLRAKIWSDSMVAYTSSSNSCSVRNGIIWSDEVLKEFDARFACKVKNQKQISN